jgi:uncharacterized protein (DUF488 family)
MIFTVGHSTQPVDHLLEVLARHSIQAVVDVRSSPYSGRLPWFNKEALIESLSQSSIKYIFMGRELGGRGDGPGVFGADGRVRYDKIVATDSYNRAIQRVIDGSSRMRVVLLCSEKDPINCHRALMVSRSLNDVGVLVQHILADGSLETHKEFEVRLRDRSSGNQLDLLTSEDELLDQAYESQASRVAFKQTELSEREEPE